MQIRVTFYSYFRDLAGCNCATEDVPPGTTVLQLHEQLTQRFPSLAGMKNSTLVAVGVEYQPRDYVLKEGDEVAIFPPVQGG